MYRQNIQRKMYYIIFCSFFIMHPRNHITSYQMNNYTFIFIFSSKNSKIKRMFNKNIPYQNTPEYFSISLKLKTGGHKNALSCLPNILIIYIIRIYNKEMQRNQSRQRINRIIVHSPQSSTYIQPSLYISKPIITNQYTPLEKNRTFSHKKLTLTSNNQTPIMGDYIKKAPLPYFEQGKLYKQVSKGNLLMQSKKPNIQDGKISLKIGNEQNIHAPQIPSPNKSSQRSRVQIFPTNYRSANNIQNQMIIKNQLTQMINSKFQALMFEINGQANIICQLKNKIEGLENQIKNKNAIINTLMTEKNTFLHKNQENMMSRRMSDVEKMIQMINLESSKAQISVNQKLDHLTKQLVQLTISNTSVQKMKKCLDGTINKLNNWFMIQESRMLPLQAKISEQTLKKIQQNVSNFRLLTYKVSKIEQELANKKEQNLKIAETKDSIRFWESFQDFTVPPEDNQMQNHSIFACDDYFFHPGNNSMIKMKSSRHSSNFTAATSTNTMSQASESNNFSKIVGIMDHLKQNYRDQLPLRCWIDKHSRIVVKDTNKLLQNEQTRHYFKVNEEETKILENRNYIAVEK